MLGIHILGEMPYPSVPKPIHGLKELRDILKEVKLNGPILQGRLLHEGWNRAPCADRICIQNSPRPQKFI